MLLLYGIVTEKQIGNQVAEMLTKSAQEVFEQSLTTRLDSNDYKSGEKDKRHTVGDNKMKLSLALRADFHCINRDDSWYELYKMYTNEKDLAEKDQQRLIRRERRRLKRKAKLRKERLAAIKHSLKVRLAYR